MRKYTSKPIFFELLRLNEIITDEMNADEREQAYRDVISGWTNGNTRSLRQAMANRPAQYQAGIDRLYKNLHNRRAYIVSTLATAQGWVGKNLQPDYDRINGFVAQRCGKANPGKKPLLKLTYSELGRVAKIVERVYENNLKTHQKHLA